VESESTLLAESFCRVKPGPIENLLGKGVICEGSVSVLELFGSGAGVAAKAVKSGEVQYKELRGGMICRWDDHLLPQDHISQKRGGMSSKRPKARLWALLFVMLVSCSPVAAEDSCGAENKFCGLRRAGFGVEGENKELN
jgi:hypothetical protein